MESWRQTWRRGLAPLLSTEGLSALLDALVRDDARLVQGSTTLPPPVAANVGCAPTGACALGYCGWQGDGLECVAEVEEFFGKVCMAAAERMGDPGACSWFLYFFDETPRDEMRRQLTYEVNRELARRSEGVLS